MENTEKLVRFDIFCRGGELDGKKFEPCMYKYVSDTDDPCNHCMTQELNENSRKPVNYIPNSKERK